MFGGFSPEEAGLITLSAEKGSEVESVDAAAVVLSEMKGVALAVWRNQWPQAGCQYQFAPERLSWEAAETVCVEQGGHLASIHGDDDWQRLHDIVPDGTPVHIGASDSVKEMGCAGGNPKGRHGVIDAADPGSGWVWSDGE